MNSGADSNGGHAGAEFAVAGHLAGQGRAVASEMPLSATSSQGDFYWKKPAELAGPLLGILLSIVPIIGLPVSIASLVFAILRRHTLAILLSAVGIIAGAGSIAYAVNQNLGSSVQLELSQDRYNGESGLSYKHPAGMVPIDQNSNGTFFVLDDSSAEFSAFYSGYDYSEMIQAAGSISDPDFVDRYIWWSRIAPSRAFDPDFNFQLWRDSDGLYTFASTSSLTDSALDGSKPNSYGAIIDSPSGEAVVVIYDGYDQLDNIDIFSGRSGPPQSILEIARSVRFGATDDE